MAADERLSAEALAATTGTNLEGIESLTKAGILRPHADGVFETGDVQRVLVANALGEAGLSVALLQSGIKAGVVSFEDTDTLYAAPGRQGASVSELGNELDVSTDTLLRIITAFGMPRPDSGTPLREPDVEHLRAFVQIWRPLGDDDLMVRAARAYGDATRRVAESWPGIFQEVVLAPLANRVVPWHEMRVAALLPGMELIAVVRSMLPWLLDQHLFQVLNQMNFDAIERQLANVGIDAPAPREPAAIVFADLAGYTRLTEERGDEAAASVATRLAVLADEVARQHSGRLVKLLGDGVMLYFPRAVDAVGAAVELRESMAPSGLPPAHAGIHAGAVIRRESDFYGRTVNVAARLAAVAGPDEIFVTDDLVESVRAAGVQLPELVELPPLELRGIPKPIRAYQLGV